MTQWIKKMALRRRKQTKLSYDNFVRIRIRTDQRSQDQKYEQAKKGIKFTFAKEKTNVNVAKVPKVTRRCAGMYTEMI